MLKIVLTYERTILHALLVYDIAPERELPDNIGTPLAELCGTDGVDSITHGDDGIEVIEQRVAPNLSRTFLLNYRDFLGSCFLVQFICVITAYCATTAKVLRSVALSHYALHGVRIR